MQKTVLFLLASLTLATFAALPVHADTCDSTPGCGTVRDTATHCADRGNPTCKQVLSCLDQPTPWFAYGSLCYTLAITIVNCETASPNSACYHYTSCIYEIHQTPCALNWLP